MTEKLNRKNKHPYEFKMLAVKRSKLLELPVENENQLSPFIDSILYHNTYIDNNTTDNNPLQKIENKL